MSLLCHFSDAVHVVSSNLLRHHTAHCQFQLQQGRSKAVVLGNGNEHSQKSHSHMLGGTTLVLNIELDNGQVASERSTDKNNDFAFTVTFRRTCQLTHLLMFISCETLCNISPHVTTGSCDESPALHIKPMKSCRVLFTSPFQSGDITSRLHSVPASRSNIFRLRIISLPHT